MFDKNDPRTKLNNQSKTVKTNPTEFTEAKVGKFYEVEPVESNENTKTWWYRGQNFYLAYSEISDEGILTRESQKDEYVLLLPDRNSRAIVTFNGEETPVNGFSLVIIPAGNSEVKMTKGGNVTRLFSILNEDLAELPINKSSYMVDDPNVAKFEPWPDPPTGPKVRVYSLDVPQKEGRFGRIFRCSTFMFNFLEPFDGPRDASKLSPHSHDDFEQCSLALEGDFVHHFRWPWTTDMNKWREDEHDLCKSPSVAVIPAGVIHTTQAVGSGINQLVDIFCPPRIDFSNQDGWVLNEDEYPMPSQSPELNFTNR